MVRSLSSIFQMVRQYMTVTVQVNFSIFSFREMPYNNVIRKTIDFCTEVFTTQFSIDLRWYASSALDKTYNAQTNYSKPAQF